MPYEAKEFERRRPGSHSHFYRVIRHAPNYAERDLTILVRYGLVCSPGTLRVEHHEFHAGLQRYRDLVARLMKDGYHETRHDAKEDNLTSSQLTPVELEKVYLDRWRNYALGDVPFALSNDEAVWSVRSELLAMSKTDQLARFVVESIKDLPHVVDVQRDLILMPRATTWDHLTPNCAPFKKEHTPELLATVLAMYRPRGAQPLRDLFSAAEILHAVA